MYRSPAALLLGLLPVATGALVGIAAVALVFGAVHGITLGFGVTLIGESVDYSIYFFIQSAAGRPARAPGNGACGPRCGSACSPRCAASPRSCPPGFPGLAQLGAYSISGLIAAAAVTRFVLPGACRRASRYAIWRPLGARVARMDAARAPGTPASALGASRSRLAGSLRSACWSLARATLWNRELSSLSPSPPAQQRIDAELRADLGAPDSLDLVVVIGREPRGGACAAPSARRTRSRP